MLFSYVSLVLTSFYSFFNPSTTLLDVTYDTSADDTTFQNAINGNVAQGYRLKSLTAFGEWPNVRYATLWIKEPGPTQVFIHGATSQQFDAWFNTWTSQGYTAVIVEATGSPGLARFAAVMENFNVGGWTLWTGVQGDEASFIAFDAQERLKGPHGRKLVWLSEYGSPSQRLVCGIWHNNPTPDKQWWYLDQPKDDATRSLNVQMTKPFWRPFRLSGRPGGLVTAIYEDTWVGHGVVQLGQTYAELSSEWYRQQMQGRRPVFLAAAGNDVQDVVYHSVWAEQANPSPRQWRATGTAHGFRDNDAAINSIDTTMKQFMQATGIRQAQVAVGKNGAVLLERAYSWSEPEKHTTVSTDRFLLASVSKMFCAAAIKTLVDSNKLTMQTKPWHLGGYPWVRPLTDTADIRVLDITIANLLDHEGGWDRQKCDTCDILFKMRDIAKTTNGGSGPPSLDDFVWYLHSVMLDFAPGTRSVYSNVGYVVLSKVVEHVSGMKYFDYLKSAVLDPLGIGNDVQMWLTDKLNHVNDPITQESSLVGLSVLTPNSNDNFVADVFGGDGLYKETALGSSSLSASASTLVKFMARFCVWGYGARCAQCAPLDFCSREGEEEGAQAWAESRLDGVDWAMVLNTREYPQANFDSAIASIRAFLNSNPLV